MVAARSANRVSEASSTSITSELGSLLLCHRSICDPHWRLHAVVHLLPVCRRFGLSLELLRGELDRGVAAAVCPLSWRARLVELFEHAIANGRSDGLALLVDALFHRDWRTCALTAIDALQVLGSRAGASELESTMLGSRYGGEALHARARQRAPRHASIDVARHALGLAPDAGLARVRGIRERSYRAGAHLLLVRAAIERGDVAHAQRVAVHIEPHLIGQVARLDIARALYLRGDIRAALRELHSVTDRRLAARVHLLRAELRFTMRRHVEPATHIDDALLHDAYEEPAWTQRVAPIATTMLQNIVRSVVLLRAGLRDRTMLEYAATIVDRCAGATAHRRRWLDLVERAGIAIDDAFTALQGRTQQGALCALRAEHIVMRAERLVQAELPEPMRLGLSGRPIANCDARSPERAAYDEGVALSAAASSRRRVLIATAQTCLRAALARPDEWPADVIVTRLRTLVHVGGSLATDAICKALVTLPVHREITPLALRALCELDATMAAHHMLEHARVLHAGGVDFEQMLQMAELHGGVPRGFAHAYAHARTRLTGQDLAAEPWLAEMLTLLRTRMDSLLRVMRGLPSSDMISSDPNVLLAALERLPDELAVNDHPAIAARLVANTSTLEALLVARPASVDPTMPAWSTERWREVLRRAVRFATVDTEQVASYVRKVQRRDWYQPLLDGELHRLGVIEITQFTVAREVYRLRVLDKRRDILTYLRFPDVPARSCMRSDSDYSLAEDTIEVWKDPLSVCCHVDRRCGDSFDPRGFLFGTFAAVDGQPALVMNSLHVRPKDGALRVQTMRAFERAVCDPLGVRLGIANEHGGKGELPADYQQREVMVSRHRALADNGRPFTGIYDDCAMRLDEPTLIAGLWWRS